MYAANAAGMLQSEIFFTGVVHRHAKGYENERIKLKTTDLVLVETGDGHKVYAITYFSAYNYLGSSERTYEDAVRKNGDEGHFFRAIAIETTTLAHGPEMHWDGAKFVLAQPAESSKIESINAKNLVGFREATESEAKPVYALLQGWPELQGETNTKYVLVN